MLLICSILNRPFIIAQALITVLMYILYSGRQRLFLKKAILSLTRAFMVYIKEDIFTVIDKGWNLKLSGIWKYCRKPMSITAVFIPSDTVCNFAALLI